MSALLASVACSADTQAPKPAAGGEARDHGIRLNYRAQACCGTRAAGSAAARLRPRARPLPSAASDEQIAALSKPSGGPNGGLYTVKDGTKVDAKTLAGLEDLARAGVRALPRRRAGRPRGPAAHRLPAPAHQGRVSQDHHDGRPEKGMPPFSASKMVMDNWEGLYAYLKGRADGQIKPGHLYAIDGAQVSPSDAHVRPASVSRARGAAALLHRRRCSRERAPRASADAGAAPPQLPQPGTPRPCLPPC